MKCVVLHKRKVLYVNRFTITKPVNINKWTAYFGFYLIGKLLPIKEKATNDQLHFSMSISLIIFIIGVIGFIINRSNLIIILISIELILLGATLNFILNGAQFDDITSQTYSVLVISLAGAESAIGLALVTAFYRLRGSISLVE